MRSVLIANLVALAVVVAWLVGLVLPPSRAMKARNAWLLRRGAVDDFQWTPASVPAAFRLERRGPPAPIAEAVDAAGVARIGGDWPRALALAGMLVQHAKREGHARADLVTTFRAIVAGSGSCSDYVRVYLAAAKRAGLFCRQWNFSFDGFGGHGHTVVEVFDSERNQWALLDVHNNVYAAERGSIAPLDVRTVQRLLAGDPTRVEFVQAAPGRLGWPEPAKLRAYYARGAQQWCLVFGNDVNSRDAGGRWRHRLRSALARLPPLVALVTPENEPLLARAERLRRMLRIASLVAAMLAITLCAQLAVGALRRA